MPLSVSPAGLPSAEESLHWTVVEEVVLKPGSEVWLTSVTFISEAESFKAACRNTACCATLHCATLRFHLSFFYFSNFETRLGFCLQPVLLLKCSDYMDELTQEVLDW